MFGNYLLKWLTVMTLVTASAQAQKVPELLLYCGITMVKPKLPSFLKSAKVSKF